MKSEHVMVLGVGCILFTDEGFGIRVVETMQERYRFPENVSLVDGGVLGLNLLGVISEADKLIVVDAIKNKGEAGDMYRIEHEKIPERIRAKNSLHQVDFLEALTMCQALDKVPETVIVGVEPQDIQTLGIEMTPVIREKVEPVINIVLKELETLGVSYERKEESEGVAKDVSCNTLQN